VNSFRRYGGRGTVGGVDNDPDGDTILLTGTYHSPAEISRSLLSALPDLVVLRPGEWDSGLVERVIHEVDRDCPVAANEKQWCPAKRSSPAGVTVVLC
jgi:hypothetical protein